jgi:hypothetical protein
MLRGEKFWATIAFVSLATLVAHLGITVYSHDREARLFANSCQTSPAKNAN